MSGILSAIKVIDFSRFLAGPLCGSILADMGATVYKIERPGTGDDQRLIGPFMKDANGQDMKDCSTGFMAANRGKRSVTLDITKPEGAQLARELAAQCDIVIENQKAGGMKKYGLDYAAIRAVKPDIVYCSITGFGQTGPYAPRPAFDSVIQAMSGMMSLCGQPDGTPGDGPLRTPVLVADTAAGLYAAVAILGALLHRQNTGIGQYIDLGMLDTGVTVCGMFALQYLMNGSVQPRAGNLSPTTSPGNVYRTRDGYLLMLSSTPQQFGALCASIGRPDLPNDPRFIDNTARVQNRSALDAIIETGLSTRTTAEWVDALEAVGVPCGAINSLDAVFNDPQVKHRNVRLDVPYRDFTVPTLHSPLRFSATPVEHGAPPVLGAWTDRVLNEELGRSHAEIEALRKAKVL